MGHNLIITILGVYGIYALWFGVMILAIFIWEEIKEKRK